MKTVRPLKQEFLDFIKLGKVLPLYAEASSALTPLAAITSFTDNEFSMLLENAPKSNRTGSYSFVATDPYLIFKSRGENVEVNLPVPPTGKYGKRASMKRDSLKKLQELLSNYRTQLIPGIPPFTGGAMGFFSYDFASQTSMSKTSSEIPEAYFIFVDQVIAFDHALNKTWIIVNPGAREQELGFRKPDPDQWARYYDEAETKLQAVYARIEELPIADKAEMHAPVVFRPSMSGDSYKAMITQCKDAVVSREIQWVHVSQQFTAEPSENDALEVYTRFRKDAASSIGAYFNFGDMRLLAASSERFAETPDSTPDWQGCFEQLRRLFPPTSATGEPKTRSRALINEIEPMQRGAYGGCLGYFSNNGAMDLYVPAPTLLIKEGTAYLQTGTNIDADFDVEREYAAMDEKRLKRL